MNSCDNVELKHQFESVYSEYAGAIDNQNCVLFSINDVKVAIDKLKKGKASGLDNVSPEHVLYAGDALANALTNLFNLCILHGFVPDSFSFSLIVLVVKDKNSDASKCCNYKPVSLVKMFSKVLELCMIVRMESFFSVDELQFGFVPNKGCQKALFTLETVINYFTCRGSHMWAS